jgi:hypothetical protein
MPLALEEELLFMLEEIEGMTRRSSLETGFNHNDESRTELKLRLFDIANYCRYQQPIIIRLLKEHKRDAASCTKTITLTEFDG